MQSPGSNLFSVASVTKFEVRMSMWVSLFSQNVIYQQLKGDKKFNAIVALTAEALNYSDAITKKIYSGKL